MSLKLPESADYVSPDNRLVARYAPVPKGWRPAGLQKRPIVYRVMRTMRTRRGFGTIIHTLTTFTPNRKAAAGLVRRWMERTVPGGKK